MLWRSHSNEATKKTVGEVELDLGRYELRRFGRRIKLEKKPMELLIFLVGRRDQMVSREEIVKKLWRSNLFIDTERNLNNIIRKIRTALGDDSAKPRFLETVVGKGYRFIGPVRVIDAQHPRSDFGRDVSQVFGPEKIGERSSLAVLPLLLAARPSTTMASAWDLPTRWLRGWKSTDVECCQLRPCWTFPLIYHPPTSLHASASDSWFTALFNPLKGNGIFRWKCLTHSCRPLASPENANSI